MSISSSVIKDAKRVGNDLVIEFQTGAKYSFAGAGSLEFDLKLASSAGTFFNSTIKNAYASTRLN